MGSFFICTDSGKGRIAGQNGRWGDARGTFECGDCDDRNAEKLPVFYRSARFFFGKIEEMNLH